MATRAQLRATVLGFLGTKSTDPFYKAEDGSSRLDGLLAEAHDALFLDTVLVNPSYALKVGSLSPSVDTRDYALPTDFASWREVRLTNGDGVLYAEVDWESLGRQGGNIFALTGPHHDAVLTAGAGTSLNSVLWLRYVYVPTWATGDGIEPDAFPPWVHGLIALEATQLAYTLGDEQRMPPDLAMRLIDRRAQWFQFVGRRGAQASVASGPTMYGPDIV